MKYDCTCQAHQFVAIHGPVFIVGTKVRHCKLQCRLPCKLLRVKKIITSLNTSYLKTRQINIHNLNGGVHLLVEMVYNDPCEKIHRRVL